MPFDFEPALSEPPPPPLVLHAAKAFSSNVFSTTFRHSNHVSFLPPTFHQRFFPDAAARRRYAPNGKTPPIPPLHRGISIYLLVLKSRLVSNETFAISRRGFEKFTTRCRVPSFVPQFLPEAKLFHREENLSNFIFHVTQHFPSISTLDLSLSLHVLYPNS